MKAAVIRKAVPVPALALPSRFPGNPGYCAAVKVAPSRGNPNQLTTVIPVQFGRTFRAKAAHYQSMFAGVEFASRLPEVAIQHYNELKQAGILAKGK